MKNKFTAIKTLTPPIRYKCNTCGSKLGASRGIVKCCGISETVSGIKEAHEANKLAWRYELRKALRNAFERYD